MLRGCGERHRLVFRAMASAADTRIQKREIFLLMTLQSKPNARYKLRRSVHAGKTRKRAA
jgi:hypothetical protein